MLKRTRGHCASPLRECGVAIYELVLTIPIYMLMIGGVVNYSSYMYDLQVMSAAAFAGTTAAAKLDESFEDQPETITLTANQAVFQFLVGAGLDPENYLWRIEPVDEAGAMGFSPTPAEQRAAFSPSIRVTIGRKQPPVFALWTKIQFKNSCQSSTSNLRGANRASSEHELASVDIPDCES